MTVAIKKVFQAVYNAVYEAGTNTRVIFHYPNAPRPELPYTSIQLLTNLGPVDDFTETDGDDGITRLYGNREINFTLNFYGENADDESARVQSRLFLQSIRQMLKSEIDVSILSSGAITNPTTLIDSGYEKRFLFDIFLLVNLEDGSTTDDIGYFDTVDTITWTNEPPL